VGDAVAADVEADELARVIDPVDRGRPEAVGFVAVCVAVSLLRPVNWVWAEPGKC